MIQIKMLPFAAILVFVVSLFNSHSSYSSDRIVVATHIEPPFIEIINQKFEGRNAQVAESLASSINKSVQYIQCPFARCLAIMQEGQADMMVAIRKTQNREQYLTYLSPPLYTQVLPIRFYLRKNDPREINQYQDLEKLNIGTLRGASYFARFDEDSHLNKFPVTRHDQLIAMLLKGRIDTFLGREVTIKARTDASLYQSKLKVTNFTHTIQVSTYIAVSKQSQLNTQTAQLSENLKQIMATPSMQTLFNTYAGN